MRSIRRRLENLLTTDQFSYPELRKMFLTLLLDQFFIFFIALLSTMLVSRLGEAAIAAVSLSISLWPSPPWACRCSPWTAT